VVCPAHPDAVGPKAQTSRPAGPVLSGEQDRTSPDSLPRESRQGPDEPLLDIGGPGRDLEWDGRDQAPPNLRSTISYLLFMMPQLRTYRTNDPPGCQAKSGWNMVVLGFWYLAKETKGEGDEEKSPGSRLLSAGIPHAPDALPSPPGPSAPALSTGRDPSTGRKRVCLVDLSIVVVL
jgi:hypothetical protein